MNPTPPVMPTGFWTPAKIERMWYYCKWFIAEYQMFIMIGTAIALAITILTMVVNLFDRNKDGEDEYDYKEI